MLGLTLIVYGLDFFGRDGDVGVLSFGLGSLAIISGALIIFGFLTAFIGFVVFLSGVILAAQHIYAGGISANGNAIPPLLVACLATSLTLIGPGAFSFDSRLFGRREIVIPKRQD